jgi:hypothetical protein
LDALRKTLKFGDLTGLNCVQPRIKSLALLFAYHDQEILDQAINRLNESTRLAQSRKAGLLFIGQILAFANEEPDQPFDQRIVLTGLEEPDQGSDGGSYAGNVKNAGFEPMADSPFTHANPFPNLFHRQTLRSQRSNLLKSRFALFLVRGCQRRST